MARHDGVDHRDLWKRGGEAEEKVFPFIVRIGFDLWFLIGKHISRCILQNISTDAIQRPNDKYTFRTNTG